jgi:hypothetical protein
LPTSWEPSVSKSQTRFSMWSPAAWVTPWQECWRPTEPWGKHPVGEQDTDPGGSEPSQTGHCLWLLPAPGCSTVTSLILCLKESL